MDTLAIDKTFNNLAALFLAEAVRSRRISLARAAEISHRVLNLLPRMNTENKILSLLTEVEKDFEEVSALKQALHFGYNNSDIKVYEPEIRDFASKIFSQDMNRSAGFLHDASKHGMTIQQLCLMHPEFSDYLLTSSNKAKLLNNMGASLLAH